MKEGPNYETRIGEYRKRKIELEGELSILEDGLRNHDEGILRGLEEKESKLEEQISEEYKREKERIKKQNKNSNRKQIAIGATIGLLGGLYLTHIDPPKETAEFIDYFSHYIIFPLATGYAGVMITNMISELFGYKKEEKKKKKLEKEFPEDIKKEEKAKKLESLRWNYTLNDLSWYDALTETIEEKSILGEENA